MSCESYCNNYCNNYNKNSGCIIILILLYTSKDIIVLKLCRCHRGIKRHFKLIYIKLYIILVSNRDSWYSPFW